MVAVARRTLAEDSQTRPASPNQLSAVVALGLEGGESLRGGSTRARLRGSLFEVLVSVSALVRPRFAPALAAAPDAAAAGLAGPLIN